MARTYAARAVTVITRVWSPHPVAAAYARALARVYGPGISGGRGTIETAPAPFAGYAAPVVFAGWNPDSQRRTGTPIGDPSALPSAATPLGFASPLDSAMAQISAGSSR